MLNKEFVKKRNDPKFILSIDKRVPENGKRNRLRAHYLGMLIDIFPLLVATVVLVIVLLTPLYLVSVVGKILLLGLLTFLVIFYFYTIYLKFNSFKIDRKEIKSNKIKSDIKVAFISDIHSGDSRIGTSVDKIRRVVKVINDFNPDIFIVGGDFIDFFINERAKDVLMELKNIKAKYMFGVYGNHDTYYMEDKALFNRPLDAIKFIEENTNVKLLLNESDKLKINDNEIYVSGVDDLMVKLPKIDNALSGIPKDKFNLFISHTPDIIDLLIEEDNIDLILSGHIHAGQIRVPILGNLLPVPVNNKWLVRGVYNIGESKKLLLSQGLGHAGTRIRFGTNCEINLITLKKE